MFQRRLIFAVSSNLRALKLSGLLLGSALLGGLCAASCVCREGPPGETAGSNVAAVTALGTPLPEGKSVLDPRGIEAFEVHGERDRVEVQIVEATGQPFSKALRAEIKEASETEWSVQVQTGISAPVEKGDVLLATFYARVTQEQEDGGGETQFVFELAGAPYTKSVIYSVRLTPEWRQIQVPFTSNDSYAVGGAQMIFRLGYEPQTIEIGGVTVESFSKGVAVARLPNTRAKDQQLAKLATVAAQLDPVDAGELLVELNPAQVIRSISPHVYGINSQKLADTRVTVRRNGGNRGTVYNWELNASSAGHDWHHVNDDWPCTVMGYQNCNEPAAQFLSFVEENKAAGADTIVTVPMLDYVSADKKGKVSEEQAAPSERFLRSYPKKTGPFAPSPDLNDGAVYQDEFVHTLVSRLGKASGGGVKFYSLDNEPALWATTHPRIHPKPPTYAEVIQRTEATALAITAVDPTAQILGGVMFGWSEYMDLNSATDAAEHNAEYGNYVEYFLASLKKLEQKHKRRLMHVFDVHWYPEARGTQRITERDASRRTIDARVQAPRSLWDPNYVEKSWIAQKVGGPIRLIPWLHELIEKRYPGTKLAMTEYNFGAPDHVSGGLAQVDVLGVFGREGVYLANYWGNGPGVGDLPKYVAAAFKLYRNYDGQGGQFGDTAVQVSAADANAVSVYAATDSKNPKVLTVMLINKDQQKRFQGVFRVAGKSQFAKARTFVLDGSGPEIKPGPIVSVTNGEFRQVLPPLSATLFVCEGS